MNETATSVPVARLAEELLEAWNTHDADRVTSYYAADYEGVDVSQPRPQRGPASVRQLLERYVMAFPDLHFTGDEIVAQGNRVVILWTASGTHSGTIMHIPPTGKQVQVMGTSLLTIEGDKVRRGVYVWDVAAMLREIGLLPDL